MLEYERQADERAREAELMAEERERMMEDLAKITREQDRIAQEEYEMRQYYEAEALKHAEEVRLHQEGMCIFFDTCHLNNILSSSCINLPREPKLTSTPQEVRRHQERVREHERRVRDHEASSEAFAKVIAMPAKPGRERQISFMSPAARTGTGLNGNGNGANGNGLNGA